MKRVATLSSLYTFYKDLGIIQTNALKASSVPGAHVNPHSRTIGEMDGLKKVNGATSKWNNIYRTFLKEDSIQKHYYNIVK